MSKFINPFSDYGFKLIFGSEVSKDLFFSFLNGVLHDEVIIIITFRNVEMLGLKQDQRRAVFDIFCDLCYNTENRRQNHGKTERKMRIIRSGLYRLSGMRNLRSG